MITKKSTNKGRFVEGKSGNPSGRPIGSRNRTTLLLEALLDGEAEAIVRKIVEKAKEGNLHALQMCLDRVLPAAKDRTVQFDLPPSQTLKDVSSGMRTITAAVSQGQLTPNEGETISRTLGQRRCDGLSGPSAARRETGARPLSRWQQNPNREELSIETGKATAFKWPRIKWGDESRSKKTYRTSGVPGTHPQSLGRSAERGCPAGAAVDQAPGGLSAAP